MELLPVSNLADLLKSDVFELCQAEGRLVGSEGHRRAQVFLRRRLAECGCVPYAGDAFDLPYHSSGVDFNNLVGVIPGGNRSLAPVLIGAHYDSVIAAPCADDNGAAVAICLALAAAAHAAGGRSRDLVFAIYDAEEPPYFLSPEMGSNYFYAHQMDDRGVHFALIYDLVGHDVSLPESLMSLFDDIPGRKQLEKILPALAGSVFMTGAESNASLPQVVTDVGLPEGLKLVATLNEYIGEISDHGVLLRNRVPYLFLSCGRWEHYHRPTDTPDRLNYEKMARITELSARLVQKIEAEMLDVQWVEEDPTVEFEIQTLRDTFGASLPLVMQFMGVSQLKNRADIKRFANGILSIGM